LAVSRPGVDTMCAKRDQVDVKTLEWDEENISAIVDRNTEFARVLLALRSLYTNHYHCINNNNNNDDDDDDDDDDDKYIK